LFGSPGGSGKSECGADPACLRIEAEELFRKAKYEESYQAYKKITTIDHKLSVGWFGMAKAGMWRWRVTPFNIAGIAKEFEDLEEIEPFKMIQELEMTKRNDYLQGGKVAYRALDTLEKLEKAGLSDMEFKSESFKLSLLLSKTLYEVLGSRVFDAWRVGCIYDSKPSDPLAYGCDVSTLRFDKSYMLNFDENGNFTVDFEAFQEYLETEEGVEELVTLVNDLLENLEEDLDDLAGFIATFTGEDVEDDELAKQVEEFKDYALFYQFNRGTDTDGDGCIDEELIVNGKAYDVDMDGLKGENARLIFIPDILWECKNIRGVVPNECELAAHKVPRYKDANGNDIIHNMKSNAEDWFIMNIEPGDDEPDTTIVVAWALEKNGFKRGPDYEKVEVRREVQTEKDENGRTKCWRLADRQERIGGCWHNYDLAKFMAYRNNPIQREKGSMNPECYDIY
jgi:hypothetical protein